MRLEELRVLLQYAVKHGLADVRHGRNALIVHQVVAQVSGQTFDEEDCENRDCYGSEDVVHGSGQDLVEIEIEARNAQGHIRRARVQHAVEHRLD